MDKPLSWFFGQSDTFLSIDLENSVQGHAGSIRLQVAGKTHVLAVSSAALMKAAEVTPDGADEECKKKMNETLRRCLAGLRETTSLKELAATWKERHAVVMHGILEGAPTAPSALVMPPGYAMIATNVASSSHGVRKAVFVKGETNCKNLTALFQGCEPDELLTAAVDAFTTK